MTRLTQITVYPIKSLGGVGVPQARVLESGALENDRRLAIVDQQGRYLNGKRTAAVHAIHAEYQWDPLTAWLGEHRERLHVLRPGPLPDATTAWLKGVLGAECSLVEDTRGGHPDDTDAPGPTLISRQTLEAIAAWFGLPVEECRRRFRANLEIDAPHAFWEDQLVGRDFTIGAVRWRATGICQRCVVPTRDSLTGQPTPGFAKQFARLREEHLPASSPRAAFDHYFRVALNTRLAGAGGVVHLGDDAAVA